MARIPIYMNYDVSVNPIGFVELIDAVMEETIQECALVPYLVSKNGEPFKTDSFGLVPRTEVDTRPRHL